MLRKGRGECHQLYAWRAADTACFTVRLDDGGNSVETSCSGNEVRNSVRASSLWQYSDQGIGGDLALACSPHVPMESLPSLQRRERKCCKLTSSHGESSSSSGPTQGHKTLHGLEHPSVSQA